MSSPRASNLAVSHKRRANLQRGRYCRICGRVDAAGQRPYCDECTDMFVLPRGERLYDADTGQIWLESVGDGTLVQPGYEPAADEVVAPEDPEPNSHLLQWIVLIGSIMINGCLRGLRM